MGRCRFVEPGIIRLSLAEVYRRELRDLQAKKPKASKKELQDATRALEDAEADGDWVEVKTQLNVGEAKRALKASYSAGSGRFALVEAGFAKLVAYIVNWSLTDAQGEIAEVTPATIDLLDTDTYQELIATIEWHDTENARIREEEKNTAWRQAVASDIKLALRTGWPVERIRALSLEDYEVLVELLNAEAQEREAGID